MGRIDGRRVVVGGLLAGLIINVSSFLANGFVFASDYSALMERWGMSQPGGAVMVLYVIAAFLLGIAAVWIYAAIRPRFGPGGHTAVVAGFAFWLLARAWPITDVGVFLEMPTGLMIGSYVWTLVESIVATCAGAVLYREEEAGPA